MLAVSCWLRYLYQIYFFESKTNPRVHTFGIVLPSSTAVEEIGSVNPSNFYGGNRPSKTLCLDASRLLYSTCMMLLTRGSDDNSCFFIGTSQWVKFSRYGIEYLEYISSIRIMNNY